jgi:hypothetical protein
MLASVHAALEGLYPQRRWGQPDDDARFAAGVGDEEVEALAEVLAHSLKASVFVRHGGEDEYCDYLYILCMGREPCLVQIRDGQVPVAAELLGTDVDELYLRVCLSNMARFAAVQQVAMELREGVFVHERPRPGVYDAPLLKRFRKLVTVLQQFDLVHLDFGEISAPPAGFDPGDYAHRYGGTPHTANYLFYPQPSNTQHTTVLSTPT